MFNLILSLLALSFLLLPSFTSACPVSLASDNSPNSPIQIPPLYPLGLICGLPVVNNLCPKPGSNSVSVSTPLGTAKGTSDADGVHRFAVRYASAERWGPSAAATNWDLPNGSDVTALPLACPQPGLNSSAFSEDCLSMILYVPKTLSPNSNVPTMVWIHGGSFIVGSATGPGLDGSKLAIATNSIVAVVQYRLGALGFMAPDGSTNLAVKDIVSALNFLNNVVPSFGGNSAKITIAGQSSGATMIRALLAVPSASSLFQSGILQSDPMDYGFFSCTTQQTLQAFFNSQISCSPSDTACLNGLSLDTIINAEMNLFDNAVNLDPSTEGAEPIRPVNDGSFITSPLDSTAPFPHQNKPLLISNVKNDAGLAIYGQMTSPVPSSAFDDIVSFTFGSPRSEVIIDSSFYAAGSAPGAADVRPVLEELGTDYIWRCSGWTFARNWVQNGGKAFVALYTVGATYPGNEAVPFCTQRGVVCHQDDIEIVFGTVPNPNPAQSALITEMQARYAGFLSNGNPNANSLPNWAAATSTNVHPKLLGASGEDAVGACDPEFWGSAVDYDYQVFDI